MKEKKKVFIIAGESSGDLLGSNVIKILRENEKYDFDFIGIGGEKMSFEGLKTIFPMRDISVMGFFEIVPVIIRIIKRLNFTVKRILTERPDLILTIDSPDFCFRILNKIKKKDLNYFNVVKKVHLIAPSVWAYKKKRAKKVAALYDLLLCILPFEPQYFVKYGLTSKFIGHPIFDNVDKYRQKYSRNDLSKSYNISFDDIMIILTPGSREIEVERIYPLMIKSINILKKKYAFQYRDYHVFTFVTHDTKDMVDFFTQEYEFDTKVILDEEEKLRIMSCSNIVLAKSGTNTFEFNMAELPMVITYKFGFFTNMLVKRIVNIKFANLVNIMADREIIPEYLLNNAKPNLIAEQLNNLLTNKSLAKKQLEETKEFIKQLGYESDMKVSETAAKEIIELLEK